MSYSIDIYNNKTNPSKDIFSFLCFVSFFPQLIAGPIERAKDLLPQFYNKRILSVENISFGLKIFLWGLFKKVVIADQCAFYVDDIFLNYNSYTSSTLVLGAFLFSIQIYADFSGYSDMAVGLAKLLGFNLMFNFRMPYFTSNLKDFWNHWHISLSHWFRDYIYIPLGGNKEGSLIWIRNVFVVFFVSGFWHGAKWTFIIWGILHFIGFVSYTFIFKNISIPKYLSIINTFIFVSFAWIFFRAESIVYAFNYISNIININVLSFPEIFPKTLLLLIVLLFFSEFLYKYYQKYIKLVFSCNLFKYGLYYFALFLIFYYHNSNQKFIYFQF